jgi:hypothetical protein
MPGMGLALPGTILGPWSRSGGIWLLAQTLGERDELVSSGLQLRDSVREDVVCSSGVDLVVQRQHGLGLLSNSLVVQLLALRSRSADRVFRVKVPGNDSQTERRGNFADIIIVFSVGRTHERGCNTSNLLKSIIDFRHLRLHLIFAQAIQMRVTPGVRGELVAFVVQILDTLGVVVGVDTFVVVTVEEECSLCAGCDQCFADVVCIDPRAVIKGQCDGVILSALGNNLCKSPRLRSSRDARDRQGDEDEGDESFGVEEHLLIFLFVECLFE